MSAIAAIIAVGSHTIAQSEIRTSFSKENSEQVKVGIPINDKGQSPIGQSIKWFTEHDYLFWLLRYAHLIIFFLHWYNEFQSVKCPRKPKCCDTHDAYQIYLS